MWLRELNYNLHRRLAHGANRTVIITPYLWLFYIHISKLVQHCVKNFRGFLGGVRSIIENIQDVIYKDSEVTKSLTTLKSNQLKIRLFQKLGFIWFEKCSLKNKRNSTVISKHIFKFLPFLPHVYQLSIFYLYLLPWSILMVACSKVKANFSRLFQIFRFLEVSSQ